LKEILHYIYRGPRFEHRSSQLFILKKKLLAIKLLKREKNGKDDLISLLRHKSSILLKFANMLIGTRDKKKCESMNHFQKNVHIHQNSISNKTSQTPTSVLIIIAESKIQYILDHHKRCRPSMHLNFFITYNTTTTPHLNFYCAFSFATSILFISSFNTRQLAWYSSTKCPDNVHYSYTILCYVTTINIEDCKQNQTPPEPYKQRF
jgi:hypothetical protein